ncbi:MAG: hypothetical protein K5696_11600 [Lachnospiraceae bacterium]|nr:hypothetical protein [Lachnospiraceae bacterium]
MEQREKAERVKWHPGFYGGIALELKLYRNILEFEQELNLSNEPLRMDMLIIKKKTNEKIANPRNLFRALHDAGASVKKVHDGIYRIEGLINFPIQIIVTKELAKGEHSALKILTDKADEYEVRRFVSQARTFDTPVDRNNADAVLQVSVSSNPKLYERIRKEKVMCNALNELMKDELEAREARAEKRGKAQGAQGVKAAVYAIKDGMKASEVRKKYGKDVYEAANDLMKSFA